MDAGQIIEWLTKLAETWPWVIWVLVGTQGLGILSVGVTAVIKLTLTKVDDEWLKKVRAGKVTGKILAVLEGLSLIKLKK